MRIALYFFAACLVFGTLTFTASAHVPIILKNISQTDVVTIEDPTLQQAYYGELDHFPHTYEFAISEPATLFVQILVPDNDSSKKIFSGLVIQRPEQVARVKEITVLKAGDARWEVGSAAIRGDSYLHGPSAEVAIEQGTYTIEVHTPDNIGKYVLLVGTRDEQTLEYFEYLGRLIEIKHFLGKTPFHIIQSPYVYVPTVVILVGFALVMVFLRQRKNRGRE